MGTVTNQGFPFQPDVLYKSKSVVGTIKATPYTMPYLLAQKRESFPVSLAYVSKSVGLIAKLSKMHQERVLPSGEAVFHVLYLISCISDAKI